MQNYFSIGRTRKGNINTRALFLNHTEKERSGLCVCEILMATGDGKGEVA